MSIVKLVQTDVNVINYWEIWQTGRTLTTHWGIVGQRGQSEEEVVSSSGQAQSKLSRLVNEKSKGDFRELTEDDLSDLTLQFSTTSFGTQGDLELRHRLEEQIDQELGWTGNGYCEGGDIGENEMSIYCRVLNGVVAKERIFGLLRQQCPGREVEIILE